MIEAYEEKATDNTMAEYIDRKAAIEKLRKTCDECYYLNHAGKCLKHCATNQDIKRIQRLTSADVVERKRGRWVGIEYDGYADGFPVYTLWECNRCLYETTEESNFCPNCGSDMRGDDHE